MAALPRTASAVIIGGGCIGASIAFHLARAGLKDVVLLEADRLGSGSTGRAAGGVRHQFATELNVRLSLESIATLERFEEETGAPADLRLTGYLMLARSPEDWRSLQESAVLQKSLGVPVHLLTPAECREFVPPLRTDDLLGAAFGERDGHAVPDSVVQGFARAARRLGATILEETPVTALLRQGDRVAGVETPSGPVAAPVVVLATGAFTRPLAAPAGLDVPIEPVRRCVYVTQPFAGVPERIPMVIDFETGFYFRREGAGLIMGMRNPDEPPGLDTSVDWAFCEQVSRRAAWVCPALAEAGI
ncbi:MAG: FAD-binding oxidoreductase, partial [Chloroflexi bacterium]|nr:FAD-binding oxidoreductase [Chloroflexota bacterium]